jgi:hypothetical protein
MLQRQIFTQTISCSASEVYRFMLGLDEKSTYESWTRLFQPTSTYEGAWEKGSKILFTAFENGKRHGMVSMVKELIPHAFVEIHHIGLIDGDQEIYEGGEIEKWKNSLEHYTFQEENKNTLLTLEILVPEDFIPYFNDTYPESLKLLKDLCEAYYKKA